MIAKRKHSIRGRLTSIIMLTTAIVVLLACVGFFAQDVVDVYSDIDGDLRSFGEMIAASSGAPLTFGDQSAAQQALGILRSRPSILVGCIYTDGDTLFATYSKSALAKAPTLPHRADGIVRRDGLIEFLGPIVVDGSRVGTVYISSDLRDVHARVKEIALLTAFILSVCLIVAFILSSRLQGRISRPIVELARVAGDVSIHKNYSVRAAPQQSRSDDEIGDLVTGFNSMLAEIEERDAKLMLAQTQLVTTVALRTGELTVANQELLVAKNAAERVAEINAKLARESALILNSSTDGIIGLGLHNEPTFLNPAAARMLGRALIDFQGKSPHQLTHHSHADGTPRSEDDCALNQAMRRGQACALAEDTFWRADGSSFPVEYSATPLFDENGVKFGGVVTFRDVTERRAIDRLKSEFVSTVSHELRTPLTSIRGALGLLSSGMLGTVSDKGRRMLEIAVANTDRLVRLINDILDLERIESGKVELSLGPVDAHTIMVQASEGLQSMADEARVSLVVKPVTAELWGDSDRIIQTLTNLLGNAIKFSPSDTTVTLSGIARESDFLFSVADQGRGVPEQKLESIFDRFSQVDASDSRDKGGSGLGLAICQSIVNAHGGRIWAEKNTPAGSRFLFTIPLAASSKIPLPAMDVSSGGNAWNITGTFHAIGQIPNNVPSVLVVEDDLDLARVMITALQSHDIVTFHADSGGDAVRLCRDHMPSLIVLDLLLPDMDGFAVVQALRESPGLGRMPLLVYSALDVGSADQTRLRLGPTEFLTKSRCTLAEFEAHVVRLLENVTNKKYVSMDAA